MKSSASLLEAHLGQVRALWQRIVPAHAGLSGLSSLSLDFYRGSLPSSAEFPWLKGLHGSDLIPSAMDWLMANAMRDLLSMLLVYLEEMRRFCEIADAQRLALSDQDRNQLLSDRLERPPTPQDTVSRLHTLIGTFPLQQELVALESVAKLFMAKVARQELSEPVTLTLCSNPENSDHGHLGSSRTSLSTLSMTVSTLAELDLTSELLHSVFFTASTIMRELALAVKQAFGDFEISE